MPDTGDLATQNIKDRYYGVNDPVANKLLRRAEDFQKLTPPEDKDITTLYVGNVDSQKVSEEDLKYVSLNLFFFFKKKNQNHLKKKKSFIFVVFFAPLFMFFLGLSSISICAFWFRLLLIIMGYFINNVIAGEHSTHSESSDHWRWFPTKTVPLLPSPLVLLPRLLLRSFTTNSSLMACSFESLGANLPPCKLMVFFLPPLSFHSLFFFFSFFFFSFSLLISNKGGNVDPPKLDNVFSLPSATAAAPVNPAPPQLNFFFPSPSQPPSSAPKPYYPSMDPNNYGAPSVSK